MRASLREAEDQFRQALAVYDKSLPANHQYRASALMYLARLLVDRGKPEDALPLSEQALSIWTATAPKSSSATAQAHAIHAYVLAHLGRAREAADELSAAVPMLLSARGPDDPGGAPGAELVEQRALRRAQDARAPITLRRNSLYAGFSVSSLYAYCSSFKCRKKSVSVSDGT